MRTTMLPDPTKDCSTEQLASLYDLLLHPQPIWSDEELTDLLKAQWGSKLAVSGDDGLTASDDRHLAPISIGDVLTCEAPDLQHLVAIKDFARQCMIHPDHPLPEQVCQVLYLCSIAVAEVNCHQSISSLSTSEAIDKIKTVMSEVWLTASARSVLENALKAIGDGPFESNESTA